MNLVKNDKQMVFPAACRRLGPMKLLLFKRSSDHKVLSLHFLSLSECYSNFYFVKVKDFFTLPNLVKSNHEQRRLAFK